MGKEAGGLQVGVPSVREETKSKTYNATYTWNREA